MSHPSLTPAEVERLRMLSIAAKSVIHAADHVLDNGYADDVEAINDDGEVTGTKPARQVLMVYIGYLIAARRLMYKNGDIVASVVSCEADETFKTFREWTEHQTYEPEVRADDH